MGDQAKQEARRRWVGKRVAWLNPRNGLEKPGWCKGVSFFDLHRETKVLVDIAFDDGSTRNANPWDYFISPNANRSDNVA